MSRGRGVRTSGSSASRISAPERIDRPVFWIIAGPNGSGKSSLYNEPVDILALDRSVWIINPDLLANRIREIEGREPERANLEAVQRIESWLEASLQAHQTVGVETVLSTDKYRRLVALAKSYGFEFRLIYVLLDSAERSIERVRIRVAKGGHAVPENKVRERYVRSLGQLPWFLSEADQAWIFDNSGASPRLIAEKKEGLLKVNSKALPAIVEAAGAARLGSRAYKIFEEAMIESTQVVCTYEGHIRELCPIVLGHSQGHEKAFVYQFGGGSSSRLPAGGQWKCLWLSKVDDPQLRNGPWISGTRHSQKQSCVEVVDLDVNPNSPYNPQRDLQQLRAARRPRTRRRS